MRWVRLRHPKTGGEFNAAESSLDQHKKAGWVPAEDSTEEEPLPRRRSRRTASDTETEEGE